MTSSPSSSCKFGNATEALRLPSSPSVVPSHGSGGTRLVDSPTSINGASGKSLYDSSPLHGSDILSASEKENRKRENAHRCRKRVNEEEVAAGGEKKGRKTSDGQTKIVTFAPTHHPSFSPVGGFPSLSFPPAGYPQGLPFAPAGYPQYPSPGLPHVYPLQTATTQWPNYSQRVHNQTTALEAFENWHGGSQRVYNQTTALEAFGNWYGGTYQQPIQNHYSRSLPAPPTVITHAPESGAAVSPNSLPLDGWLDTTLERREKRAPREKERREKQAAREKERREKQAARERERQEKQAARERERQEKQAARREKRAPREKERQEKLAAHKKKQHEKQAAVLAAQPAVLPLLAAYEKKKQAAYEKKKQAAYEKKKQAAFEKKKQAAFEKKIQKQLAEEQSERRVIAADLVDSLGRGVDPSSILQQIDALYYRCSSVNSSVNLGARTAFTKTLDPRQQNLLHQARNQRDILSEYRRKLEKRASTRNAITAGKEKHASAELPAPSQLEIENDQIDFSSYDPDRELLMSLVHDDTFEVSQEYAYSAESHTVVCDALDLVTATKLKLACPDICPFSDDVLSELRSLADEMDTINSSGGQWQYTAWIEPLFLTERQKDWLRRYEQFLWIKLVSTKIGFSSSLVLFLQKMQSIQSYYPFAIVHYRARRCEDGENREQCLHFILWPYNVSGERFLLTNEQREQALEPFPDETPSIIITGHTDPRQLLGQEISSVEWGNMYAGSYHLPPSTKINLRNLNEDFCEHVQATKLGTFAKGTTPYYRFGGYAWGSCFDRVDYQSIPVYNPYSTEKWLQTSFKAADPSPHIAGEWFEKEVGQCVKKIFEFLAGPEVETETYQRAGKRKHFSLDDIKKWRELGRFDDELEQERKADTTLSIN